MMSAPPAPPSGQGVGSSLEAIPPGKRSWLWRRTLRQPVSHQVSRLQPFEDIISTFNLTEAAAEPNAVYCVPLAEEFIVLSALSSHRSARTGRIPDLETHAQDITKILAALKVCLEELKRSYISLTLTYTSGNLLSNGAGRAMFNAKKRLPNDTRGENLDPLLRHYEELGNGRVVVAMALVAGCDLDSTHQCRVPQRALKNIKDALLVLQAEDWVFGDLRWSNIMLSQRDAPGGKAKRRAVLADFD